MADTVSLTPFVTKTVSDYARILGARKIPFERIIVFGSHAKGSPRPGSDIDVCVVSSTFGSDYHGALVKLITAAGEVEGDLDIVAYTPSDLADRYDPLASEIRAHGGQVSVV